MAKTEKRPTEKLRYAKHNIQNIESEQHEHHQKLRMISGARKIAPRVALVVLCILVQSRSITLFAEKQYYRCLPDYILMGY